MELLGRLDTPLGRRQYARLIGVMLKEPFADSVHRTKSISTEAVIALHWKQNDELRRLAPGTWQFLMMRALLDASGTHQPLTDEQAFGKLTYYKYETSLAKFVLQAFRKRICGDAKASKEVSAAIAEAKRAGVNLTKPTTAYLSVGFASTVALSVANLMPPTVAAVGAPVIGGIALLLIQVGVDGFCAWSREAIAEADETEKSG